MRGGGTISGATLGNGKCYTDNRDGTYTFSSCDDLAACAGQSDVKITASPTSLPASGGTATFTIAYYGKTSSFSATKSGGWSGSVSCAVSTCPSTVTATLNASSTTAGTYYTLTYGSASATVSQKEPVEAYAITGTYSNFSSSYATFTLLVTEHGGTNSWTQTYPSAPGDATRKTTETFTLNPNKKYDYKLSCNVTPVSLQLGGGSSQICGYSYVERYNLNPATLTEFSAEICI